MPQREEQRLDSRNRVLSVNGGAGAHLQTVLLKLAGAVAGHFEYRGMQRFSWFLSGCFSSKNSAVITLPQGGKLAVELGDGYWSPILAAEYVYEPEILCVLNRALRRDNVFFVDCGANVGYWSVTASAIIGDPGRVIAVEASPPCFAKLEANSRLNGGSFRCVMRALWHQDSEELLVVSHDRRHAGSSVVNRREKTSHSGYTPHRVRSITLDTLSNSCMAGPDAAVVIKLDVEGAEIHALRGGRRILSRQDTLLIYEDHPQDLSNAVSHYVLHELGYCVYYLSPKRQMIPAMNLADIERAKHGSRSAANFFACPPGSPFIAFLERAAD